MRYKSLLAAVAVSAAGLSPYAYAHSPMENSEAGDLARLVDGSNLVFIGKVERLEYRNARGEKGEGLVPYAIVTYRVGEVLRGKAPGKEITMRIIGGADGSGRFLTATGVPIIQGGDQDLLFVGDTSDPTCPLVSCEHGRFRILNERVYDTYGSPVRAIREAKVVSRGLPPQAFQSVRFPTPKFDDLMRNPEVAEQLKAQKMPAEEARRRYEAEAPKFIELRDEFALAEKLGDNQKGQRVETKEKPETFAALPLAKFVAEIRRLVALNKRKPNEVKSIDPKAEIVVAKLNITKPQKELQQLHPVIPSDDEYKAYERNEFNPVMRK